MFSPAEQAKMLAYAEGNHGNISIFMGIKTAANMNHTVTTDDAYCKSLSSSGITINSNSNINTFGNENNYNTSNFIIPLRKKHYLAPVKFAGIVKYESTQTEANIDYREISIGIHNFENDNYCELLRGYFTPVLPSVNKPSTTNHSGANTAIRDVIQINGYGIIQSATSSGQAYSTIKSDPDNVGLEMRIQMCEGDVLRSVSLDIEIIYHE